MSRKGNSPDNGMMDSFFGILKSEIFYGYEKTFQSLEQLEQAIVDYIDYYNNKRIKVKLKHTKISSEEISDGRKYSLLFHYVEVEVFFVKSISALALDVATKTDKTPVLGRMLSKYVGRKTSSIENDITKARCFRGDGNIGSTFARIRDSSLYSRNS